MTKNGIQSVANEVIETHLGYHGAKRDEFAKASVPKLWAHFDVLNEGFLDISKVPQFLRMLVGNTELAHDLQLQLSENIEFRPDVVQSPWAEKKEDRKEKDAYERKFGSKIKHAFGVNSHKSRFYERETPERWDTDSDDQLMRSLIEKYAVEGNTDRIKGKGAPDGTFYLDKANLYAVSQEVIGTHMKLSGKKRDEFVDAKFPKLFEHFDVNQDGYLVVDQVP